MAREGLLIAVWRVNKVYPWVIAVLLVLNVLVAVFLYSYWSPKVEGMERELMSKQTRLRTVKAQSGMVLSPQEYFRQGEEDLETFFNAIPKESEFTGLIEELFRLAQEAGLTIDAISYSPKPLEEWGLLQDSLSFSINGSYGQIKQFIFSLEQSPRLMTIEQLSLGNTGSDDQQQVTMRVQLVTFFRLEAA